MTYEQLDPHENVLGRQLLNELSAALKSKDRVKLRVAIDCLQNTIDETQSCTPMRDIDLDTLLKTGEGVVHVGTGSAGERIYIEKGTIYMPFSEADERRGYGKEVREKFRRVFGISENQELEVYF